MEIETLGPLTGTVRATFSGLERTWDLEVRYFFQYNRQTLFFDGRLQTHQRLVPNTMRHSTFGTVLEFNTQIGRP